MNSIVSEYGKLDGIRGERTVAPAMSEEAIGEAFVDALASRDSKRLEGYFHPEVRLRALVPSGFQESEGVTSVMRRFESWFGEAERIQILRKEVYSVTNRLHIGYRFREYYSDGDSEIIEQDAYCDVRQGLIEAMDFLCSGHLLELGNGRVAATDLYHRFDAGDLGCGSGLPQEFRSQIGSMPIGGILEIVARDPSAREDLPSLARLLGHRVLSVRTLSDGSIVIAVQRGR